MSPLAGLRSLVLLFCLILIYQDDLLFALFLALLLLFLSLHILNHQRSVTCCTVPGMKYAWHCQFVDFRYFSNVQHWIATDMLLLCAQYGEGMFNMRRWTLMPCTRQGKTSRERPHLEALSKTLQVILVVLFLLHKIDLWEVQH